MKNVEIAEQMGVDAAFVSKMLGDPRAVVLQKKLNEDFIEQFTQDTQEHIQAHTLEASKKNLDLMRNAKSERVQQVSAHDILDRGGFKPKEQVVTTKFDVPDDVARQLVSALIESRKTPEPLEMIQDSSGVFKAEDDVTSARK